MDNDEYIITPRSPVMGTFELTIELFFLSFVILTVVAKHRIIMLLLFFPRHVNFVATFKHLFAEYIHVRVP